MAFDLKTFTFDLLLFAKASLAQIRCIQTIVSSICASSGQRINPAKSKIYFSPNVPREISASISLLCGFSKVTDLGRYFGVPIIPDGRRSNIYADIVSRVQTKLAGWKANCLSLAGRATLIQSVTQSIPVYTMHTTYLPTTVCDSLDQLNRDFLWGCSDSHKKPHLLSWDKVCQPKAMGCLGLRKTRDMNLALLAKLNWSMLHEQLWGQVFSTKYLHNQDLFSAVPKVGMSSTWASILRGRDIILLGLQWSVGNGDTFLAGQMGSYSGQTFTVFMQIPSPRYGKGFRYRLALKEALSAHT